MLKPHPLYYSRHFFILGRMPGSQPDIVIKVYLSGRCRLVEEDPAEMGAQFWYYGVNPGGVSGCGPTPEAAKCDFSDGIEEVLYDLAAHADSFDEFKARLVAFVQETNEPELRDWLAARRDVREGRIDTEGMKLIRTEQIPYATAEFFTNDKGGSLEKADVQPTRFEPIEEPKSDIITLAAEAV